jgi:crotonobetainyl-CoA:carnitine CoA-transferase CaiB-like acyl-CoA transferase
VLDLTRVRAGPTCCRVLADFGADVIKIEAHRRHGPQCRRFSGARHGYDMLNLHRNKRSITLNLKDPDGQALFHAHGAYRRRRGGKFQAGREGPAGASPMTPSRGQ